MGRELVAALLVLLHLLLVDRPDLRELVLVVGVLDGRAVLGEGLRRRGSSLLRSYVFWRKKTQCPKNLDAILDLFQHFCENIKISYKIYKVLKFDS